MCSFVFTNQEIKNENEINKFIKLRGPDYTNKVTINKFTFIHNLLSITGKFTIQPFIKNDIVLVYNGEIYNYKDFGNYNSDGECLIPLYKEFGENFISKLDGEFAIALIDFNKRIILLATDVFATKPLWVNNERGFTASIYESPLKVLGLQNNRKIDANRIIVYFLDDFSIKSEREWYKFDLKQFKHNFDDWNMAFSQSVAKRAKSNIRERIFIGLSSGYDSGSICCEMLKQGINFKSYTVVGTHENRQILTERHNKMRSVGLNPEVSPYTHNSPLRNIAHNYIINNVEQFYYKTYSSSSNYNEFNLSIYDDNGANGLSHVASLAKKDGYKIYLSGQGADEIFADYGFGGNKMYSHSNFGGLFPEDLKSIFPWASFYGSSQISYLMKEESIAGSYGIEARYPFLDPQVVQEFLWISSKLKNKWYKSVLHNYLIINKFPFDIGRKVGF